MKREKKFHLSDGKVFTNLKGFAKVLLKMPQEVYNSHVNSKKNDFSQWMHHSMRKKELAKRIDGQISKVELELEVLRHLIHHEPKNKKSTAKKKK